MKHLSIIKRVLIALSLLPVLAYAQFPIISSVPPHTVKNLLSSGLSDNQQLTIKNTGTVPLTFCMAKDITSTCVGLPIGITVNAATTASVTVKQLGGISIGTHLHVTNESGVVGGVIVTDGGPLPLGPCPATTDPSAWVNDPRMVAAGIKYYKTMYLCPSMYSHLVINQDFMGTNPDYTLSIGGTAGFTSDIYGGRNLSITGNTNLDQDLSIGKNLSVIGETILSGPVGIGTNIDPNYQLSINGKVRTKSIKVEIGWSDFVFAIDYKLMPLKEVEEYIKENHHLPQIPDAETVETNGADLGELVKLQMQKIEELTLYMLQQQKEIEELKANVRIKKKL
jgi:hypothetical protein